MILYYTIIVASICIALFVFYIIVSRAEYIWCVLHNQIPFVASSRHLRKALVAEIHKHFPHATSLCDIGAGYGGLARYVARNCNMSVVALENMPFTISIARIMNMLTCARIKIIKCNAFKYLATSTHFDIGVAYLGPNVNYRLADYTNKFDVIITFDVPIDKIKPTRVINVGYGATRYGRTKFPHKLFVYDLRK